MSRRYLTKMAHDRLLLDFVSPVQRYRNDDTIVFAKRVTVYEQARARHPGCWSKKIRDWSFLLSLIGLLDSELSYRLYS